MANETRTPLYDAEGRKVRTEYRDAAGTLVSTNEYNYKGKETLSSSATQTYFYAEGSIARQRCAVRSPDGKKLTWVRDSWRDRKGEIFLDRTFDAATGELTKEKKSSRDDAGILHVQRTTYQPNPTTGKMEVKENGEFIALGGQLYPTTNKDAQKILVGAIAANRGK